MTLSGRAHNSYTGGQLPVMRLGWCGRLVEVVSPAMDENRVCPRSRGEETVVLVGHQVSVADSLVPWYSTRYHQSVLVGVHNGLGPVPEHEFGQQSGHMGFDRCLADEQSGGDLRVGQAARH
jgi:hypothetical protein